MPNERLDVELEFRENGLIPAVAQDADTGDVLMLAYVSADALAKTQNTGLAHYYVQFASETPISRLTRSVSCRKKSSLL